MSIKKDLETTQKLHLDLNDCVNYELQEIVFGDYSGFIAFSKNNEEEKDQFASDDFRVLYDMICKYFFNKKTKEEKKAKTNGDQKAKKMVEVMTLYREALLKGKSVRTVELDDSQLEAAKDLMLLTAKPILYVCNVDESAVVKGNKYVDAVREAIKDENAELLVIGAGIEADIAELESFEEKQMFLEDLGLEESGVNRLIKAAYKLLDLQTFLTAGPKEVRAWTFRKGMKAPQTAGIIHSDFEKGFIRAEVIKYEDYVSLGSEAKCKEMGKMSVEGKEYVVQDGDIMHFRFNV